MKQLQIVADQQNQQILVGLVVVDVEFHHQLIIIVLQCLIVLAMFIMIVQFTHQVIVVQ